MGNKLELTWYGKEEPLKIEPRLLIENVKLSYGCDNDGITDNMLIHGDNLLALKALEKEYTAKIKCIYIDPPFNTGQAFEHYDDKMEMSIWLDLMRSRLQIMHSLLRAEGTLFVHIDDAYLPYLTILLDEIFGRINRMYLITFKQGAATGHKAINPGCVTTTNFILIYAKDKNKWNPNKVYTKRGRDDRYGKFITNIDVSYKDWNIITLTEAFADYIKEDISTTRKIIKQNPMLLEQFVIENAKSVIRTARPDIKSVGKEIQDKIVESKEKPNEILYLQRENSPDMYFINGERILFYSNKLRNIDGEWVSAEPLTTLWDDILSNNLHNEGGVSFPKGKKPEHLIKRAFEIATQPGDIVLDSFLGSGTTIAVAHKMGRKFIGIEMGEQAYTHCKLRLDLAIDGKDISGITKAVNWQGGGGYHFYELAPSLIVDDMFGEKVINPEYNADMLAATVALHEGFTYQPDESIFWKQSKGNEDSFLYVTTKHITGAYIDSIRDMMTDSEYLIIACRSYDRGIEKSYRNITVKKIPQMLLSKCEFGRENYNLNIIHPLEYDEEDCDE